MQVYKNILVTIDCSPVDNIIVQHVALLAVQNRAKVSLLHVIHAHTIDQRRVLREQAEVCLDAHCETLRSQAIDVCKIMPCGEPGEQILKEIENGDYDLVAMATHGHKFPSDILFGSVSEILKHKISIPLLLIKPDLS
jgi:nucleotide-binding universal stress UspA family protein